MNTKDFMTGFHYDMLNDRFLDRELARHMDAVRQQGMKNAFTSGMAGQAQQHWEPKRKEEPNLLLLLCDEGA